jgi:hypothetical protein
VKQLVTLFTLTLYLAGSNALACSFGPGYELRRPPTLVRERVEAEGYAPPVLAPNLQRGSHDGDPASCSDAGVLVFSLGEQPDRSVDGYEFRLVSGVFPDTVEFPEFPVQPIELREGVLGFRFVWLDLPARRYFLEPIEVVIEVRRHSTLGEVSRPTTIAIEHQGGSFRNRRPAQYEIQFD